MNAWLKHVKSTMKRNPNKPLKDVLQMAKKTYKKSGSKTAKKLVLRKGGKRKLRGGESGEKESQEKTERSLPSPTRSDGFNFQTPTRSEGLDLPAPTRSEGLDLPAPTRSDAFDFEMKKGGKRHKRRQTRTRKHNAKGGKRHKKRQTSRTRKHRKM